MAMPIAAAIFLWFSIHLLAKSKASFSLPRMIFRPVLLVIASPMAATKVLTVPVKLSHRKARVC